MESTNEKEILAKLIKEAEKIVNESDCKAEEINKILEEIKGYEECTQYKKILDKVDEKLEIGIKYAQETYISGVVTAKSMQITMTYPCDSYGAYIQGIIDTYREIAGMIKKLKRGYLEKDSENE